MHPAQIQVDIGARYRILSHSRIRGNRVGAFSWTFRDFQVCFCGKAHTGFESSTANPEKQLPIINMFCPQCTVEYRDGFMECADCKIPLVQELPPQPPDPKVEYRDLHEVIISFNPGEISFIKSVFDSENIPYLVQGENFSLMRGGSIPVRFLVPIDHIGKAKNILKEIFEDKT